MTRGTTHLTTSNSLKMVLSFQLAIFPHLAVYASQSVYASNTVSKGEIRVNRGNGKGPSINYLQIF